MSKVFPKQFSDPQGFWVNGCLGARRSMLPDTAERARLLGRPPCGPSDINGAVPAVTAPTVPGPGVRIPKVLIKRKARSVFSQLELPLSGELSPVVKVVL